MDVAGGRRKGRPERRWMDSVNVDLREKELSGEDMQNRAGWKQLVTLSDKSTPHRSGKRYGGRLRLCLPSTVIHPIHAVKACLPSLVFLNRASYRR